MSKIYYTKTDEAPALATYSFLPIVKAFIKHAGIEIEIKNISLTARIIANFPDYLTVEQRIPDALAELGSLVKTPDANIIKLPNISASVPQLKAAIKELQDYGYNLPDYPEEPENDTERNIKTRYAKVLGSAVNPVLREGNSDRRVAAPVKQFAKDNPHYMGKWDKKSKSHIATMTEGDFYATEKSVIVNNDCDIRIELVKEDGQIEILKQKISLLKNEVIDAAVMDCKKLYQFYVNEIEKAKLEKVLLSLHLKATMMKVSDPIMFGYAVKAYYKKVFDKYDDIFTDIAVNPNNGISDIYTKIEKLPTQLKEEIQDKIKTIYTEQPNLAMVDSSKGITNLYFPNKVIIDASMPAAIRNSGQMLGADGNYYDTKALIPDRCYAGIYQETIKFCKENGAFDVKTMGSVSNIGLMAQKAEEYGSHDKTFEILDNGIVRVLDFEGNILIEHKVEKGDIWRMCQTKDIPVKDWVKLAVNRAESTSFPTVFWLDENRAHDVSLIKKVDEYLREYDTSDLDIKIMPPVKATHYTLTLLKEGKDVISVTGNVLRDYLTDLFPIFELGSSSKMLSIVPLLASGGLYETGAGGTAPDLVEMFLDENHLCWDSLGEFLALAVSLEDLAEKEKNNKVKVLSEALNKANRQFLKNNKAPSRKVNELDNRGSHFYLTMYWAQALAEQDEDKELKEIFKVAAGQMKENKMKIIEELNSVQGKHVDVGGYYHSEPSKTEHAMRPSVTFNRIIESL